MVKMKYKRGLITLLGVAIVLSAVYSWWKIANYHFNDLPFDRKVWLSNTNNFKRLNPRGQMVDDLKGRWLKNGMTRADVVKLLGQPDPPEPKSPDVPKNGIEYGIGNWSGCPLCPDALAVIFDRSGRLIEAKVTEH